MTATLRDQSSSFEITLLGYLFPDLVWRGEHIKYDMDANSLDVSLVATHAGRRFETIARGQFLTGEVDALVEWMERVAARNKPRWGFSGVELYPSFDVSEGDNWIEVSPWHNCPIEQLRIRRDATALRRFASELRRDVAGFPLRKLEPSSYAWRTELERAARSGVRTVVLSVRAGSPLTPALLQAGRFAISHGGGGIMASAGWIDDPANTIIAVFRSIVAAYDAGQVLLRIGGEAQLSLRVALCMGQFEAGDWRPGGRAIERASGLAADATPGTIFICPESLEMAHQLGLELG